jgi:hypothetical protein
MSNNKCDVRLAFPYGGNGELLVDCVRAYLHAGSASGTIRRVLEGLHMYRAEKNDPFEYAVMGELQLKLEQMYDEMKALEDHHFSM